MICSSCGNEFLQPFVCTTCGAQKLRDETVKALEAEVKTLRVDAERYRKLRLLNWHDSALCVVSNPRETVRLGTYCPSQEQLDEAIDAAREWK
jgi:hypothetical protein